MQPAAADVEGDIRRSLDGMAASADAVARFQHDDREPGGLQRPRRAEAGGAGADDGDIDFGGEGHGLFHRRHSGMRLLAQARNPYSRSWLWIPGSRFASLRCAIAHRRMTEVRVNSISPQ